MMQAPWQAGRLKIFNQEYDEQGNAGKSGLELPAVPVEFLKGLGCPE
jgi:hypothetical protein